MELEEGIYGNDKLMMDEQWNSERQNIAFIRRSW